MRAQNVYFALQQGMHFGSASNWTNIFDCGCTQLHFAAGTWSCAAPRCGDLHGPNAQGAPSCHQAPRVACQLVEAPRQRDAADSGGLHWQGLRARCTCHCGALHLAPIVTMG